MSTCPFCSAEIDEGLSRFGGNCPHCFNVIPGEEAATDPGVPAAGQPAEEPESSSSKTLLVFGFLAVVAIGASVGLMGQGGSEPEPAPALIVSEEEVAAQIEAAEEKIEEEAEAAEAAAEAERVAAEEAEKAAAAARIRQQQARAAQAAAEESSTATEAVSTAEVASPSLTGLPTGPTREASSAVLTTPSDINRAVRNSLKRYKGQLNQCYDKQLIVDDGLQGTWQVAFTVEENGTTSGVVVTPKGRSNADFESCMNRQVSSWTFPRISSPHPYIKEYSFRP